MSLDGLLCILSGCHIVYCWRVMIDIKLITMGFVDCVQGRNYVDVDKDVVLN